MRCAGLRQAGQAVHAAQTGRAAWGTWVCRRGVVCARGLPPRPRGGQGVRWIVQGREGAGRKWCVLPAGGRALRQQLRALAGRGLAGEGVRGEAAGELALAAAAGEAAGGRGRRGARRRAVRRQPSFSNRDSVRLSTLQTAPRTRPITPADGSNSAARTLRDAGRRRGSTRGPTLVRQHPRRAAKAKPEAQGHLPVTRQQRRGCGCGGAEEAGEGDWGRGTGGVGGALMELETSETASKAKYTYLVARAWGWVVGTVGRSGASAAAEGGRRGVGLRRRGARVRPAAGWGKGQEAARLENRGGEVLGRAFKGRRCAALQYAR